MLKPRARLPPAARPSRRCPRRGPQRRRSCRRWRPIGDRLAIEADGAAGVVVARNREGDALRVRSCESRIATTGMPSTLASLIASSSLLVSMTNMTSGRPPMSRMPPSDCSRACRARGSAGALPSWSGRRCRPTAAPQALLKRLIELEMVFQLVSMPPSQRWLTKCWPRDAGRLGDRVLRLALGADEQHLAAAGDGLLDEVERAGEQRNASATGR